MRRSVRFFRLFLPTLYLLVPLAFADGVYDGLWIGTEKGTVPGLGTEVVETSTIIYQEGPETLYLARLDLDELDEVTSMRLVKQGRSWVLPTPINGTILGVNVVVDTFRISFSGTSRLTGTYTFEFSDGGTTYRGTVDMAHTKQSCTSLGSSSTSLSGISGREESIKCYTLQLPTCATNFSVSTAGGSGDVDLYVAYGQPDFDYDYSDNYDNSEQVFPTARAGIWFIGLVGFESYRGVTLQTSFSVADSDGDGVGNCIDACPTTPVGEPVDASGCAASERDDDADGVPNGLDNCPVIANADQADNDTDGEGDACDSDDDNDGLADVDETTIYGTDPLREDTDNDGVSDGDEVIAGTDPLVNPAAVLSIINLILEDS